MACCAPLFSAAAQTVSRTPVKPKSAQGHKAPMRHDQLTLYPHDRSARRQSAYGYTRHRFDQPPRSTILLWACSGGEVYSATPSLLTSE
jgi:hypothetical protein